MAASEPDPMAELALAIQQGGTLAWVLKYQRADASDPVQAAWAQCSSGSIMREVLEQVAPDVMSEALSVLVPHWQREGHMIGDNLPCCADVLRRAVPIAPTLGALLAAIARSSLHVPVPG